VNLKYTKLLQSTQICNKISYF